VNTGTTPKVQYGHASGAANTLRPTTLTYPNGRVITRHYGAADSMADVLSRVAALVDSDGPSTQLVAYTYLGLGTTVEASSPQPGIKLTYIQQAGDGSANTGGGDQYTGFDRFGRVIDQFWLKTGSGAVERVQYGFDRNGNRLWRDNLVAGTNEQDEHYTYDGLQQLLTLDRGNLNAGRTAISGTPSWEEDFAFDPTGNWDNYLTKVTGTTALNQNRTHNPANEILTLSGSSTLVAFNAAGNMTKAPKTTNWASAYDLVWDAWNRLAQVKDGATTVAAYAYDGLTRRVTKTTGGTTRHFYYSAQWQILEERVGASTAAQRQFVWGERYPDDLVLRDRDTDGNGSLDERLYVQHDYFHPTAVSNTSGAVQERYGYDAYGLSRVMTPAFGARSPSSYDWETRYGAYRWDSETGLYQVRHRYLHPTLGRWLSRDPIGEVGFETLRHGRANVHGAGPNGYAYVRNQPLQKVDPLGLAEHWPTWPPILPPSKPIPFKPCPPFDCKKWANENKDWLAGLPDCPCSINGNPDPNVWYNPGPADQSYHPGASQCMRSKPATDGGPGQQCCYDTSSNLITGGAGAGTPDKVAPVGPVDALDHYFYDVVPFNKCALEIYLQGRPPNNGNSCQVNII
jgi:RHS repeat-associated protein